MGEATLRTESATEYFRERVESAMKHQRLTAHEQTSFYVVNLLARFVRVDRVADSLGIRFAMALGTGGIAQRNGLREVGDESLFISGFFSDSLNRKLVDVDYYIQLGSSAYGSLARHRHPAFGEVFDELASNFTGFVDVLSEVSEQSALTSNTDLLRLYEKWLRTGSRHSGDLLVASGIVPFSSGGNQTIQ